MKLRTPIAIALAITVAGCLHEEWTGLVYPNRADLSQHIEIGTFPSFAECQNAVIGKLRVSGWATSGDYQCGLNCKRDTSLGGLLVCKEIRK